MWGRLKVSRPSGSPFYALSETIKSEKDNAERQINLDEKYYQLVEVYLKAGETLRAMQMSVSCIRTIEAGTKMVDLFDLYNKRALAIQLEEHYE